MIAVISWMAGLLYLPRIFVYHAESNGKKIILLHYDTGNDLIMAFWNIINPRNRFSTVGTNLDDLKIGVCCYTNNISFLFRGVT